MKRILTPDQKIRVFVSSLLNELAPERESAREAITQMHMAPVMFELGARPHPPGELYRAYLDQSDVFLGIYWQAYGWIGPHMTISGLEDEYNLSGGKPKLIYLKRPAPNIDPRLSTLLNRIQNDAISYKLFSTVEELRDLIANDLARILTESFMSLQTPPEPNSYEMKDEIRDSSLSVSEPFFLTDAPLANRQTKATSLVRRDVFISYSHRDKKWLEILQEHLRPYIRQNIVKVWSDTQIKTGENWKEEIKGALATAKVAVLLVSPSFLASDFIADVELPPLLEAAEKEGLKIIWIAVRASAYKRTLIARYQAVNDPSRPLDSLDVPRRNKEFVHICDEIATAAI